MVYTSFMRKSCSLFLTHFVTHVYRGEGVFDFWDLCLTPCSLLSFLIIDMVNKASEVFWKFAYRLNCVAW